MTITRRSRDIRITITIPLPRRFWRRKRVSEDARRNMSKAQRQRFDRERGQLRIDES